MWYGKCQFINVSCGSFFIQLFFCFFERVSLSTVSPPWTSGLWLITEALTALKSKHRPREQNLSLRRETFNLSSHFITAITFIFTFSMTAFFSPCRCIQQMTFWGSFCVRTASKRARLSLVSARNVQTVDRIAVAYLCVMRPSVLNGMY